MPRYTPESVRGRMVEVYVDGAKVERCTEVDDDLGFAIVLDRDAPTRRRLLTGKVTVCFPNSS